MVLEDAWKLEPDFGKRVRALRTLKGIPQRQMARFGLKQAYMASIEGGTVLSPSREMIDKIAKAFEVSGGGTRPGNQPRPDDQEAAQGVLPQQRLPEDIPEPVRHRDDHPLPLLHRSATGERRGRVRDEVLPLLRDRDDFRLPGLREAHLPGRPATGALHELRPAPVRSDHRGDDA